MGKANGGGGRGREEAFSSWDLWLKSVSASLSWGSQRPLQLDSVEMCLLDQSEEETDSILSLRSGFEWDS